MQRVVSKETIKPVLQTAHRPYDEVCGVSTLTMTGSVNTFTIQEYNTDLHRI